MNRVDLLMLMLMLMLELSEAVLVIDWGAGTVSVDSITSTVASD